MKVLCDVHISYKVVRFFKQKGVEAVHVNELPDKWFTKDAIPSCFTLSQPHFSTLPSAKSIEYLCFSIGNSRF